MAEPSNSERFIFRLSLALVSLHVVDDNFLQPQPGTSAGDHVVSGLVPLALLAAAALVHHRLRAGAGEHSPCSSDCSPCCPAWRRPGTTR